MKFLVLFFSLAYSIASIGQNKKVDFILHVDPKKENYKINDIMNSIISERKNQRTCIEFNIISNIGQGNSPYIFELWEYGDYTKSAVFSETRTKSVSNKDGSISKQNYNTSGISTVVSANFYGRLIQRETLNALDIFIIDGDLTKEIVDEEIKETLKSLKYDKHQEFKDAKLAQNKSGIESKIKEIELDFKKAIKSSIKESLKFLAEPPVLADIRVEKDGKLKDVNFLECVDHPLSYGGFSTDLLIEDSILGIRNFVKCGAAYLYEDHKSDLNPKPKYLKMKDGEVEVLKYLKEKRKVYALENPGDNYYFAPQINKDAKKLDFVYFYQFLHNYTPANRLYLELLLQSQFLKYRNVAVNTNNNMVKEWNDKNFDITKKDSTKKEDIIIDEALRSEFIYAEVFRMEKPKEIKSKFIQANNDPNDNSHYGLVNIDIISKTPDQIEIHSTPSIDNLKILNKTVSIDNLRAKYIEDNPKILGLTKMEGEKDDFVVIEGYSPLSKGDKYEVYTSETITKNSKSIGVLKIIQKLNPYYAICKIDDGKKELTPALNAKKTLFLQAKKGGFFSNSSGYMPELKLIKL